MIVQGMARLDAEDILAEAHAVAVDEFDAVAFENLADMLERGEARLGQPSVNIVHRRRRNARESREVRLAPVHQSARGAHLFERDHGSFNHAVGKN